MILEFCVKNYLSIKEEQKISFVASSLKETLSERNDLIPLDELGMQALRTGVIYGANASGKTNVLKALAFYKNFITNSFISSQAGSLIFVQPFRLDSDTAHDTTAMEATFADGEYLYRYGFEINTQEVHSEWLYQKARKKRAKEVELLSREGNVISVHPKCPLVQELVNKKMIRDNALVLSTAAQFNDEKSVAILKWISNTEVLFCSEEDALWEQAVRHLDDEDFRNRITRFARYADLGIESISKIDNHIVSSHPQYDKDGKKCDEITFSFTDNESEGTIKYFSLAYPILSALDNGKRLFVDELDSKLHPLLIERIVRLFNSAETNPFGAQLLFTTHDTFLLSAGLFRRDQIWFTQKDSFAATEIYSLVEYKVRSKALFERDYLQGKYGAIPIIGDLTDVVRNTERV